MTDLPRRQSSLLACCVLRMSPPVVSMAEEPAGRPIVSGFERFFVEPGTDLATGGRLLIGELNCTSCHQGDDAPVDRNPKPADPPPHAPSPPAGS